MCFSLDENESIIFQVCSVVPVMTFTLVSLRETKQQPFVPDIHVIHICTAFSSSKLWFVEY